MTHHHQYNRYRYRHRSALGTTTQYVQDDPVDIYNFDEKRPPRRRRTAFSEYQRKRRQQNRFFLMSFFVFLAFCSVIMLVYQFFMPLQAAMPEMSLPTEKILQQQDHTAESNLAVDLYSDELIEVMSPKIKLPSSTLPFINRNQPFRLNVIPSELVNDSLTAELQAVISAYPPEFVPHLYFYNFQTGQYVNINANTPVSAASVIKLPVLHEFYRAVDAGWLGEDSPIYYLDYHKAGGAGRLQYKDANIVLPAYDVVRQMIQISDNTCTNLMIEALGGQDALNQQFRHSGLMGTKIDNWLPDLQGTNFVTAKSMAELLYNIETGSQLSEYSRSRLLEIIRGTHNRRLIPAQLPKDVIIEHKTGDIGTVLGDVGLLRLPDGRRYILSVQVERPFNDYTARDMIQELSKVVYDYMNSHTESTKDEYS